MGKGSRGALMLATDKTLEAEVSNRDPNQHSFLLIPLCYLFLLFHSSQEVPLYSKLVIALFSPHFGTEMTATKHVLFSLKEIKQYLKR